MPNSPPHTISPLSAVAAILAAVSSLPKKKDMEVSVIFLTFEEERDGEVSICKGSVELVFSIPNMNENGGILRLQHVPVSYIQFGEDEDKAQDLS